MKVMNTQNDFLGFSCAGSILTFECESEVCPDA